MDSATSTFGLVERFKKGETEAFSLIFRKYQRRLAVLVHYKMSPELRGAVEADDILQEVFLAAAQDISNFTYQSPGSFMAWLSRIADQDRKSTRLNSSHGYISYAVFCLKKKKKHVMSVSYPV